MSQEHVLCLLANGSNGIESQYGYKLKGVLLLRPEELRLAPETTPQNQLFAAYA